MPVIPEETTFAMDDFINWDNAGEPSAGYADPAFPFQENNWENFDLALANIDGDDFSAAALEHFESSNLTDPLASASTGQLPLYNSPSPSNLWPTLGDQPGTFQEQHIQPDKLHSTSTPDLTGSTDIAEGPGVCPEAPLPKIGARFSREALRILKTWLSSHQRHPYPTEEEKSSLQNQTGLNKTQIANWLANARRRGKIQPNRSTSPSVRGLSSPVDIPKRRGTPASFETPLQRWANSPPEHEAANITAIASAVLQQKSSPGLGSGRNSPYSLHYTDDSSSRSLCKDSTASSFGTSQSSGGSFASAYSHQSQGSFGSFQRGRRRRRRRTAPKTADGKTVLNTPLKTFQCTFCTETFRTKHDWQRHEKSLHLSLERWICAPHGPQTLDTKTNQASCVFCGSKNPDEAHIDSHNYSSCQERVVEERTFYRKDHLRQHLRLVHNSKFVPWMESWKSATAEVRSRCGFCGIALGSWGARQDHLAEHFKSGKSMKNWKGDWGFEPSVLHLVENAIDPYMIHDERNSPFPFEASQAGPETPRNAYDLVKYELAYFIENKATPTDEELQVEACRVIFSSELSDKDAASHASWLRDMLMSSEDLTLRAKLGPIRGKDESLMSHLRINGKGNIFEDCPLEAKLAEYVKARQILGLTAMDSELQSTACRILSEMDQASIGYSKDVGNFIVRKIYESPKWLAAFRRRNHLPRSEDIEQEGVRSKDPNSIDATVHNYSRLEHELAEFVRVQLAATGIEPSDEQLQKRARMIVYELDDGVDQTTADNAIWLKAFKERHLCQQGSGLSTSNKSPLTLESLLPKPPCHLKMPTESPLSTVPTPAVKSVNVRPFFMNGGNCHRRVARELARWVASVTSPQNPQQHIPSDAELQHQARWIMYDDDDPWNTTAADNTEWLLRFKRSAGILPADEGAGLVDNTPWNIIQGDLSTMPPANVAKSGIAALDTGLQRSISSLPDNGTRPFETELSTTTTFPLGFTQPYQPLATVFCSSELEDGLTQFAVDEIAKSGHMPSDETLKINAREISGNAGASALSPADDPLLLEEFKDMINEKLNHQGPDVLDTTAVSTIPLMDGMQDVMALDPQLDDNVDVPSLPTNMDVELSEQELHDIMSSFSRDSEGNIILP